MPPAPFGPLIAALWTPADDAGELLEGALRRHLAWIRAQPVTGLMPLGSTGEWPHFDETHRLQITAAVAAAGSPLPTLANASAVSPASARRMAAAAAGLGCAAVVMLPPSYFALNDDDLLEFFMRVADATTLPVWLYDFPARVGNRIRIDVAERLAQAARLEGVKLSGADEATHREFLAVGRDLGFAVYTGSDLRAREAMGWGCQGIISGLANFLTQPLAVLLDPTASPESVAAANLHLKQIAGILSDLQFPLDVAAGMEAAGFERGAFKSAVSAPTLAVFESVVQRLKNSLAGPTADGF